MAVLEASRMESLIVTQLEASQVEVYVSHSLFLTETWSVFSREARRNEPCVESASLAGLRALRGRREGDALSGSWNSHKTCLVVVFIA